MKKFKVGIDARYELEVEAEDEGQAQTEAEIMVMYESPDEFYITYVEEEPDGTESEG